MMHWLKSVAFLAVAVSASGCAGLLVSVPDTSLAPGSEVQSLISTHYRAYATEDRGLCKRPYFSTISEVQVVEEEADRLVLEVGYFYRDRLRDEEDTNTIDDFGVRGSVKVCRGFDQRQFTLARQNGSLAVVDMSGAINGDRRQSGANITLG
jgi:hypothetical protein